MFTESIDLPVFVGAGSIVAFLFRSERIMPGPLSVECPQCGAKLKLKDRSKLGKKAACPKCREPFVLTAPPEDDELDEFADFGDDEFADFGDNEEAEYAAAPSPRRRSAARSGKGAGKKKTAGKKKKKRAASQSSGGGKIALFVGGGVTALLLLVAVGLWALGVFSGDAPPADQPAAGPIAKVADEAANKIDLAYLPADAELIVHLKVAQAWQSPLFAQLVDMPDVQAGLQQMQQTIGLAVTDVESVTFGMSGVSDQAKQGVNADPMAVAMAAQDNVVVVVRLTKEVDAASLKLVENGGQKATHSDQTYYRMQLPQNNPQAQQAEPVTVFLAGPKLIVIGTEAKVKAAIAAGGKQPRRADLDFVDADQDLLIVFVPKDKSALTATLPDGGGGPDDPAGEMAKLAAKNLKAFSIGIKVGSGFDLQLRADCVNDTAAGEIKTLLDNWVAESRASFQESKESMPPPLIAVIEPVLGSLQTSANSQTVTASINVSQSTIATIKQSPFELMGMMMAGMMAGGGNGMIPGGLSLPGLTTTPPVSPTTPATPAKLPTTAPEGLEVSAIARWSENRVFVSSGKELPRDLELWVYLIGKQPQQAMAWGQVKVTEMTTGDGQQLKIKSSGFGPNDATKSFLPVQRNQFRNVHPQQGVKAVLAFPHPQQPVSIIKRAAGSVALQVATEQKVVILKNVQSLVGKPIDDPLLKQAGLKLQLTKENMNLNLKINGGNALALAKVEPVDAAGKPLQNVGTFRQQSGNQVSYGFSLSDRVPVKAGMKLTLNIGISQVEVPFDLQDIRVPLPPGAPGKPPAGTEGIPAGLTLAGKTAWSTTRQSSFNRKGQPPSLDVLITVLGKPAEKAVAWGFVKVKEAKGSGGVPLKLNVQNMEFNFFGDPTKEFIRVERGSFAKHPDNGVRAVISLAHPSQPVEELAAIEGSMKLLVAKRQTEVTIAKISSRVGKTITHPDLTTAKLRFKLQRENMGLKLSFVRGDPQAVDKIAVVDANGKPLQNVSVARFSLNGKISYTISSFDDKLPATAALKLTVNQGLTELSVPFRFENLPVPDLPKK
jgi:hypothetical protein